MDSGKHSQLEFAEKATGVEITSIPPSPQSPPSEFSVADLDFDSGRPLKQDPIQQALETRQCTVRSILVGSLFGIVIGAANVYLGLKTGWGMSAGVFAIFASFAVIKAMEKSFPHSFGGGYFGPKENVSCQSAANGACSGYSPFVAAVPAMYSLGLLNTPKEDFGKLICLGIVCAFYGTFFAVPLRKFYILQQRLRFPEAIASAIAIKTLHASPRHAKLQIKCLILSFLAAFTWTILNKYAPGILYQWNFFWYIHYFVGDAVLAAQNWGWGVVETSPAFFGLGVFVGLSGSIWFYVGTILAWGILGPITVATGLTQGRVIESDPPQVIYFRAAAGSPRYWLLWPGLLIMICASFTEVAMGYKGIWIGIKTLYDMIRRRERVYEGAIEDPAAASDQIPVWAWVSGLFGSIILSIILLKVQFGVGIGNTILAVILAFLFSFIGIQATGTLAINPVGPIAKCSQLIFGGISKAQGQNVVDAQMVNLVAGSLAGQAASHSVDMVGDLKIGHLMSATPRGQFWAQLAGTVFTVVPMTGFFLVFTKAYPCIIDHTIEACPFQMPAVMAWKAVAQAMTTLDSPIPKSSGITAIILGLASIATGILKHKYPKYAKYYPNWVAIGLGLLIPGHVYASAMVCGALAAYFMNKYKPELWSYIGYPLAAGLAAGESCSGVLTAGLVIAEVDGGRLGTMVGCPWGDC